MTIRLTNPMYVIEVDPPRAPTTYHIVFVGNQAVALADTDEEAQQAKRAFELVLAPRFTRDEAIAIVKKAVEGAAPKEYFEALEWRARSMPAVRLALEALAAEGAFVDGHPRPCEQTDCPATMSAKLDAAGIR